MTAAKGVLSSDETARRLRPALVALSVNNPRQALKQSAKHLPHPAAVAVHALAQLHLGRRKDAEASVEEMWTAVKNGAPVNTDAAYKISLFWRELGRLDKVAEVFLGAWEREGGTEMGEMAFVAKLAAMDWGSAGRIAARLQKAEGSKELWRALAVYLNGVAGNGGQKMIGLSAALINRWVGEGKCLKVDEVRFCIRVLKTATEGSAARKILRRCEGMGDVERMLEEASLWEIEGNKKEARGAYERLIQKDHEDWDSWLRWIRLHEEPSDAIQEGGILRTLMKTELNLRRNRESLSNLHSTKNHKAAGNFRGVYLAELEILKRCKRFNALRDCCIGFFQKFCSHPMCAQDLRPYLLYLQSSDPSFSASDVVLRLATLCPPNSSAASAICFLQMWLFETSVGNLTFKGKDSAGWFLLSAQRERYRHRRTDEPWSMKDVMLDYLSAALVLESGRKIYPEDTLISLALADVYASIGAVGPCVRIFRSLDVRNIQLISVSHLLLPHTAYLYASVKEINEVIIEPLFNLQAQQWKDYWNTLPCALQNRDINVAVDIVLFQRRLARSEVFARARIQRAAQMISQLLIHFSSKSKKIFECNTDEIESDLLRLDMTADTLVDNTDFELMSFWHRRAYNPRKRHQPLDRSDRGVEVQGEPLAEKQKMEIKHRIASLIILLYMWNKKIRKMKHDPLRKTERRERGKRSHKKFEGEKAVSNTEDSRFHGSYRSFGNVISAMQNQLIRNSYMYSLNQAIQHPDDGNAIGQCIDHLISETDKMSRNGVFDTYEQEMKGTSQRACFVNGYSLQQLGSFVHEKMLWTVALLCVADARLPRLHEAVAKCIANLRSMLLGATRCPTGDFLRYIKTTRPWKEGDKKKPCPKPLNVLGDLQVENKWCLEMLTEVTKSYEDSRQQLLRALQTADKCLKRLDE